MEERAPLESEVQERQEVLGPLEPEVQGWRELLGLQEQEVVEFADRRKDHASQYAIN